jgi:hypothetical protein
MNVIAQAAEVIEQTELARIADVLEQIRPVPRIDGLIGAWAPDPSGYQHLICIWVRQAPLTL